MTLKDNFEEIKDGLKFSRSWERRDKQKAKEYVGD